MVANGLFAFTAEARTNQARTVALRDGDVAEVRTAIGYSTILEFETKPTSAVLGDQDAFKVEYIGSSLAVKPLVPSAKTNLFVFTDYDRFNLKLVTGSRDAGDYLVKIRQKKAEVQSQAFESQGTLIATGIIGLGDVSEKSLVVKKIKKSAKCQGVMLGVVSVGWPPSQNTLIVDFTLEYLKGGKHTQKRIFEPGDIEILQAGKSVYVESLYLDGLDISDGNTLVNGTVVVRQSDLNRGQPFTLGFSPSFIKSSSRRGCLRITLDPFEKTKNKRS